MREVLRKEACALNEVVLHNHVRANTNAQHAAHSSQFRGFPVQRRNFTFPTLNEYFTGKGRSKNIKKAELENNGKHISNFILVKGVHRSQVFVQTESIANVQCPPLQALQTFGAAVPMKWNVGTPGLCLHKKP